MKHISWDDSLDVDVEEINDDHHKLVNLFNILSQAVDMGCFCVGMPVAGQIAPPLIVGQKHNEVWLRRFVCSGAGKWREKPYDGREKVKCFHNSLPKYEVWQYY